VLNHFKANIDEKKLTEPINPTTQGYRIPTTDSYLHLENLYKLANPEIHSGTLSMLQNAGTAVVEANKKLESAMHILGAVPELKTTIGKTMETLTNNSAFQSVFPPSKQVCSNCGIDLNGLIGPLCGNCSLTVTSPDATKLY
jgi:hypothetical protein